MTSARALAVFTVAARGIRVRIRVLPTIADVDAECQRVERAARVLRAGRAPAIAFYEPLANGSVVGTIYLPADGRRRLTELVPHELAHAVVHRFGAVESRDDEAFAATLGRLVDRTFAQLARRGIEVAL